MRLKSPGREHASALTAITPPSVFAQPVHRLRRFELVSHKPFDLSEPGLELVGEHFHGIVLPNAQRRDNPLARLGSSFGGKVSSTCRSWG